MAFKRPVVTSAIAACLLVMTSSHLFAHLTVSEFNARLQEAFGDTILGVTPVLDAPFSAEALMTWQPRPSSGRSEWRASARYYRDRRGRARVEQMFVGDVGLQRPQRVIVAPDPDSPTMYVVDHVERKVGKIPRMHALMTVGGAEDVTMAISNRCFVTFSRPQTMNRTLERNGQAKLLIEEESLGQRWIGAVRVAGTRFNTSVPAGVWNRRRDVQMTYERWVSPDLKLEVASRSEDSQGEVIERQLTNISRAEPPAELFDVPAEYAMTAGYLVAETLWLNPDVPHIWPAGASPAERCMKPWP
jgi:hypothetical protein